MKKRLFSVLLVVSLFLSLFSAYPLTVSATCSSGIKYNGLDGLWIDINADPYTYFETKSNGNHAYKYDGCAWFASARSYQITGVDCLITSGQRWYEERFDLYGYSRGQVCRAKSLACYSGHVLVIEKVVGNDVLISEGGTGYSDESHGYCIIRWTTINAIEDENFLGYVYLTDSVVPIPQGSEMTSGYDRVMPDGDYIIANAGTSDKSNFCYLDIDGVDCPAANETNVHLWGPTTDIPSYNVWTISYSNGFYSIKQKGTNMALDVYEASISQGANVQVYIAHSTSAQKWAISHNGRNGYRIQAKCSGMSLDVNGGGTVGGTNIQQWKNNDSDAQSWLFIPYNPAQPIANGRYVISSALANNKVISTDLTGDIQNIFISSKGENIGNSVFEISKLDNGYYKVIHCNSGKVLTVAGGVSTFNANVALSVDNNTIAKQWAIIAYNGKYKIISRCNGYALDVTESSTSDGTNIMTFRRHTDSNQQWSFVPAEVTVKFDANGGSSVSSVKVIYGNNLSVIPQTRRNGCTFLGWYTSKTGGSKLTTSTKITSNVTYYAHWYDPCENGEHSWESWIVTTAATCTTTGVKTRICTQCGNTETGVVPATGHAWGEWAVVTPANCFAEGLEQRICANDPAHIETRAIPATGHTFANGVCTVCGAADPNYISVTVGDVTGDGKLNSRDVIALMKLMLSPNPEITAVSDINSDGKLNSRDVIALMKLILTQA